jgi:murein DD-endopeptidase MepM/ murein hydrolase activator NlpD
VIATVGRSGLATAPHLHYEILVRGRSVDPLRNSLISLLAGERPKSSSAPPQPDDSALRDPILPHEILVPDVPGAPFSGDDAIIISAPAITNTTSLVNDLLTGIVVPPAPAVARRCLRRQKPAA